MDKAQQIKELIERGVENIYPSKEIFEKILLSEKKLRIYHGIDPTGSSLHLGHVVQLLKLKQFQDLGHKVVILIGDFTAQIGDPTDKAAVRKQLTKEQVANNFKDYKKQIGRILDIKKIEFRYNSEWLGKLNFKQIVEIAANFTAQQMLARDMFKKRIAAKKDLYLHEFLYPMMQAYDSVMLDVDLETGGSDQMFNMLCGRTLMKKMKEKEKFVLTTKLLEDTAGIKMGKTTGNMVSLSDDPSQMYGKVMSWTDEMILPGFEIATDASLEEISEIKKDLESGKNPKELKMLLAYSFVKMYHGEKYAKSAEDSFKKIFEEKLNPNVIEIFKIKERNIIDVLVATKLCSSKSEARRLLAQGGVRVDGREVKDENFEISQTGKDGIVIQKGKRYFAKVIN